MIGDRSTRCQEPAAQPVSREIEMLLAIRHRADPGGGAPVTSVQVKDLPQEHFL